MSSKDYLEYKLEKQSSQTQQSMSIGESSELSQAEHEKITNMCNAYGLNEEETRQLIEELKAGGSLTIDRQSSITLPVVANNNNANTSISTNNNSSNQILPKPIEQPDPVDRKQPSIVETRNEELSFNDSQFRFEEEYSFKQTKRDPYLQTQQEQSFERMLMHKLKYQEEFYERMRQENEALKAQKMELTAKVTTLLKIKQQQSELMLGLKNTICSLTGMLKDKEQAYAELQENYYRLTNGLGQQMQQSVIKESREIQGRTSDLSSKGRPLEKRQSRQNLVPQGYLRESTNSNFNNNMERRQSKEFSKTKSTTNFFPQKPDNTVNTNNGNNSSMVMRKSTLKEATSGITNENSYIENLRTEVSRGQSKYGQLNNKKQNGKVDIGKYKVFIDELRSICINKQQKNI